MVEWEKTIGLAGCAMEKEIPLYQMIYNKLVNRILLGLYPKGYRLSSVEKIRERFGVGYTSIRRALRLLHQEGFIRLEERRRPVVIFDAEEPRGQALRQRVFLSRRQAHLDCYRAIPCLIPGLAVMGARRCGPRTLETLEALCGQPEELLACRADLFTLAYAWLALVVRQADSALADDLFLQIRGFDDLRFLLMPREELVPGEAEAALLILRHWTDLLRREQWDDLRTLVSVFCWRAVGDLERSFAALDGGEAVRPVEFRWYVRQLPAPLYQKIAWDLLRTAYLEGMEPGTCFPSEAALMERYGVAVVTVRGALALLNSLGAAQTVNGVGTLLTGAPARGEIGDCLRESRESLEILTGCGQALAAAAAPRLSRGEREALRAGAVDYRCRPGLLLWLLRRLAEAVRSQALEKVLEQLEVRCIFGLYLRGLPGSPEQRQYAEDLFRRASDCLAFLEAGDADAFARRFGQLCREAWEGARERLTPEEN